MSILLHPKVLLVISEQVANNLNKHELSTEENIIMIKYIKKLPPVSIKHDLNQIIPQVINIVSKLIQEKCKLIEGFNVNNSIDKVNTISKVHHKESFTQQNICDLTQLFGISDKHTLARICNISSLYTYNYMLLNTANSSTTADNIYHVKWQVLENNLLSTGTVNINPIKNIVAMRIFPIKFNYINGQQYHKYYNLLIEELIAQSMLGYGNRNYHFTLNSDIFYTSNTSAYIECRARPVNNEYKFNPPITTMSSITISMSSVNGLTSIPLAYISGLVEFTNPISILLRSMLIDLSLITHARFYDLQISRPELTVNATFIANLTRSEGWNTTTVFIPWDGSTRLTIPLDGTVIDPADIPISYFGHSLANVNTQFTTINTVIPMCFISLKNNM